MEGKLPPEQVTDADIVFVTISACAAGAPPTAQPIPIKVYAEFTYLDPETVSRLQADLSREDGPTGRYDYARADAAVRSMHDRVANDAAKNRLLSPFVALSGHSRFVAIDVRF